MNGHTTLARAVRYLAASLLVAAFIAMLPAPTHESFGKTNHSPGMAPSVSSVGPVANASLATSDGTGRPGTAGMIVGLDPETGRLGMPTQEQREEISRIEEARRAASSVHFVEEHRPDGTVHVDLKGQFQEFATVQIRPDGSKVFRCDDDSLAATRVSKDALPAAPALEVR